MADRFPLIVNAVSQKIEEIVAGDNLELTGNGLIISGDTGAGKYLTSNGTEVFWGIPGDVYLTQTQTLLNKTLDTCVISGTINTITDIPNSALVNSGISINGVTYALGSSVTTPDNNTTYTLSAQDGLSSSDKIFRLTSGGNSGAGVSADITFSVGSPSSLRGPLQAGAGNRRRKHRPAKIDQRPERPRSCGTSRRCWHRHPWPCTISGAPSGPKSV